MKIVSDKLIFSHLATLRSPEPVRQLTPQDVARFSLRDTINRIYKSASVKHQKSDAKKLIVYEADGGQATVTNSSKGQGHQRRYAENQQPRQRPGQRPDKADSSLARHNEYQQSGSLSLMGASQLTAGNKIELTGFGQLSGPWLITTARHSFDRSSGYVTELDVARGPVTQGKAKKSKKPVKTRHSSSINTMAAHPP